MKGRLTPISPTDQRTSGGHVIWKCICHCGKTSYHDGYRVRKGIIKSCGCSRTSRDKQKSGLKTMYQDYKHNAWSRMLSFKITFKQFVRITSQSCFYCKQEPTERFRKFYFKANGIDRKNNSKGYVLTNLVPCCTICNRAKGEMNLSDFMNYLRRFK